MSEVIKKLTSDCQLDGKEVIDELGRKIILRKANIMDRFYLLKAMGNDSSNSALVAMMICTIYVAAIDGSPFPTPRTQFEAEASLKRLADEGYLAVSLAINEYFEKRDDEAKTTVKK